MNTAPILSLLRDLLSEVIQGELQAAVEAALENALPEVIRRAQYPEYMSREEAADYLSRSVRSLDGLRASGVLPYTKRAGRVLLAVKDLDAYLAEGRVPSKSPINSR